LQDRPATPFRVPPGLQQMRIDAATGLPAGEFTKDAIWEAFVPGTEPDEYSRPVLDGSSGEVGQVVPDATSSFNPEGSEPDAVGVDGAPLPMGNSLPPPPPASTTTGSPAGGGLY